MKQVILLYLILQGLVSVAQDQLNELTVDRPGIAEAPFTVAPRTFQLETGFDYYKRTSGEIFFLPVTLFRTGLSKNTELRISVKNIQDKTSSQKLKGFSPLTVGIKTHIIEQRGWIPETDILVDLIFPLGNSDLQPADLGHDVLLLFQNDLSPKTAINYNIGVIWDGFSDEELFTASFCFNYLPTDKVGLFIEYFDFLRSQGAKEHGIDGGFTFLLHRMIQADLSAGLSWVDGNQNHFVSSGISFRIE
ncbi:MAG: transporter [Cyclobacteriaceae bacterium]